jgi:CRISPR-associated protein Cmr6
MPIAAVPAYLGQDFRDASPGMRFGMYLRLWGVNRRTQALLWKTFDVGYELRGQERREREVKYENKTSALAEARVLNQNDKRTLQALAERQKALRSTVADDVLLFLDAIATAPFTTGLGNEHPLENGFAFLWPYGLPYLPGSGVKGVLRRAAEELADGMWSDKKGWSKDAAYRLMRRKSNGELEEVKDGRGQPIELSVIDVLFGREPPSGDSNAVRGALSFWDVIPRIEGDSLLVEVMTPHQSHYYQQKNENRSGGSTTPHDSGQPNPICFLTVPPGSQFTFHVACDAAHLARLTQNKLQGAPDVLAPADGRPLWQHLLEAAFEHAFQWLGFGAKTAVGYGAMATHEPVTAGRAGAARSQKFDVDGKPAAAPMSSQAQEAVWDKATLSLNPGTGEIKASFQGKKTTAGLRGPEADALLGALGDRANKLKKDRELKNVAVRVRIEGNMITLLGLVTHEQ